MFGGGFGGQEAPRDFSGEDIKIAITISFEENYLGTVKKVSYSRNTKLSGIDEKTCSICHGSGRVSKRMQTPFGTMQTQTACSTCGGVGHIYAKDGRSLDSPFEKAKEIVEVKIPEGITDGVYIKFAGKGNE
jgi:molecular chaperone DnaJ